MITEIRIGMALSHTHRSYVMVVSVPRQRRWTEEEAGILTQWWGIRSARQIGDMLGRTKSSVIGRADRMGLDYE